MTYMENSNQSQIGVYKVGLDDQEMSELNIFYVTSDFTWSYYEKDHFIYLSINDQI